MHFKKLWRHGRRIVRWCRIALLLLLLLGVCGMVYLNKIGLPDFIKNNLLAKLRERGLDLHFSRLRLDWYRGIVAENVNLGRAENPFGPQLFIDEAELHLNHSTLKQFHFEIDEVKLRHGRLCWPLPATAHDRRKLLILDDMAADLHLLPRDQWELSDFHAHSLGAEITVSGTLTNASKIQQRELARSAGEKPSVLSQWLREMMIGRQQCQFSAPPRMRLSFSGDAESPSGFKFQFLAQTAKVTSPWGASDQLVLSAHGAQEAGDRSNYHIHVHAHASQLQTPPGQFNDCVITNRWLFSPSNILSLSWQGRAKQGQTPWGTFDNIDITGTANPTATEQEFHSRLDIKTGPSQGVWGKVKQGQVAIQVTHPWTGWRAATSKLNASVIPSDRFLLEKLKPFYAEGKVDLAQVQTQWGAAEHLRLGFKTRKLPAETPRIADAGWAYWAMFEPYSLDWDGEIDQIASPTLVLNQLMASGQWRAPEFQLGQLHARLYDGALNAKAQLNVRTRELRTQTDFNFDLHQIAHLLTTNAQHFLRQYNWSSPPRVGGQFRLTLPVWTNQQPDFARDVWPSLSMAGSVEGGTGSFQEATVSAAQFHFSLTNGHWQIPDLLVVRPEGRLELAYHGDADTRDYSWNINSHIDLKVLKPLLTEEQQRGLDLFQFTEPPEIKGTLQGRWFDLKRLGFTSHIQATNLTFRGEWCGWLDAEVQFTNQFLHATSIVIQRGEEQVTAPGVGFDLAKNLVFLTNVTARINPMAVGRAIGPKTAATLAPYHFEQPPKAFVNGYLVVPGAEETDLQFNISGGPFRYWRFNLPEVSGTVLWKGDSLVITNLEGNFYQGRIAGNLAGDFSAPEGANLGFRASVTNVDFHLLLQDLSNTTNKLEGQLGGQLDITRLNTVDWKSWQGSGRADLRQGVIWDIPLFGFLSPVLNKVIPGLGNNRAEQGSASFTIKNSVIYSKNLEIRTPALRLYYDGTVDFEGQVNARVEASLLRDVWLVGRIFSLALAPVTKLFEYRVTGTLDTPKSVPIYIFPKFLLAPLHPVRTFKDLFFPPSNKPPASVPPQKPVTP